MAFPSAASAECLYADVAASAITREFLSAANLLAGAFRAPLVG